MESKEIEPQMRPVTHWAVAQGDQQSEQEIECSASGRSETEIGTKIQ
jgi:hypothetical protein